MVKLEEVFKNIDSKLLKDADFQKSLQESIDAMVLEKSEIKAQELFEKKQEDYIKALDEQLKVVSETIVAEQKEKFNEEVSSKVKELSEAYGELVKEEAEAHLKEEVEKLQESVMDYVTHAVQQFVDEAEPKWQEESDVLKANKIMESFTNMSTSFIEEMTVITGDEKLSEVNKALDESVKSQKALKIEINEMKKEKLISEAIKDLTAPQKDTFLSLVSEISFVSEDDFKGKLDLYKSALGDSKKVQIKESNKNYVPSWQHKNK